MKTEFTEQEKNRVKIIQQEYNELDKQIKRHENIVSDLIRDRKILFSELWHITNPDYKSTFDRRLLPYGWDR